MQNAIDRVGTWVEKAPPWLRPPLIGGLLVIMLTASRGGLVGIPIILVALLLASSTPLLHAGLLLLIIGLAVVGGVLAGFSYSLSVRWLKHIPVVGPYVAGMATFFPYGVGVVGIVRLLNEIPLLAAPDGASVFTLVVSTLLLGPTLSPLFEDA